MTGNTSAAEDAKRLRLRRWIWIISGLALAVISLIIGFLIGRNTDIGEGIGGAYPFIPAMVYPAAQRKSPIGGLALSGIAVLSFLSGLSPTVFGDTGVDYSVYSVPNRKGGG